MFIDELLKERKLSKYRLAKLTNIPYSTINDICNHHASINKCNVLTVYKIANALDVKIEDLLEEEKFDFELFKSELCHHVKRLNDINFITDTLKNNSIRQHYQKKEYLQAFYLLAMVDYLSRVNNIPLCKDYDDIRKKRLKEIKYPKSVLELSRVLKDEKIKEKAFKDSIPEFKRFNIVENEVRNVY